MIVQSHRPVHHSEIFSCTDTLSSGVNLSRQYATSGVRYAQKQKIKHDDKDVSRSRVHRMFYDEVRAQLPRRDSWRPAFCTMPGIYWSIEKQLRNSLGLLDAPMPRFYSYEIDPAIYRAGLNTMPGQSSIRGLSPTCVRSKKVTRYECIDVCDAAPFLDQEFTGVWLDFCGPLSMRRIEAFNILKNRSRVSVITFLKGRYTKDFGELVRPHGGTLAYLTATLGQPVDVYNYGLMMQVSWRG